MPPVEAFENAAKAAYLASAFAKCNPKVEPCREMCIIFLKKLSTFFWRLFHRKAGEYAI